MVGKYGWCVCTVPVHGFADVRPSISRLDGCSRGRQSYQARHRTPTRGPTASSAMIRHRERERERWQKGRTVTGKLWKAEESNFDTHAYLNRNTHTHNVNIWMNHIFISLLLRLPNMLSYCTHKHTHTLTRKDALSHWFQDTFIHTRTLCNSKREHTHLLTHSKQWGSPSQPKIIHFRHSFNLEALSVSLTCFMSLCCSLQQQNSIASCVFVCASVSECDKYGWRCYFCLVLCIFQVLVSSLWLFSVSDCMYFCNCTMNTA